MGKIPKEDNLKRGMFIKTSRFHNRVLVVLDRPIDGIVRLLDVINLRVFSTTVWGMGVRTRRVGAGNPRHSTYSVLQPLWLNDIEPCMHIEVRDRDGNRLYHGHVQRVIKGAVPTVALHDEVHHRDMVMFAADMGLVPYISDHWSAHQRTYAFGNNRRISDFLRPDQAIPLESVRA